MPNVIVNLFRSRKFVTALAALIAAIVISFIPDLRPVREELIFALTIVASVFIGGTALEDAARNSREDSEASVDIDPGSLNDEAKQLLESVIDELEGSLISRGVDQATVQSATDSVRADYGVKR